MQHYVLIEDGGGQLHQIETDDRHMTAIAYIYYGCPALDDHSGLLGLTDDADGFESCDLTAEDAQQMLDAADQSDGGYCTVAQSDSETVVIYVSRMGASAKSYLGITRD